MPNYAWNTIAMKASDYKKYAERIYEEGNPTVDFNVLLPMPRIYAGNAIKYVCRYRNKNGIKDLKKAEENE